LSTPSTPAHSVHQHTPHTEHTKHTQHIYQSLPRPSLGRHGAKLMASE
jgi:hypothetical protein